MENNSLVRPTGKFRGKGIPDIPVGTFRMDFSVPLPRFSNFIPVQGPQKEICYVHLGNNGLRHSVSVYIFVFSVLTRWNRFQIINAFLLESVGTWCLK